jgi:hypothetical protein
VKQGLKAYAAGASAHLQLQLVLLLQALVQLLQSLQLLLQLWQREQLLVHVLHLALKLVRNCCQLVTCSCHGI